MADRNGSFLLKWEHNLTKENFPVASSFPYNRVERDHIAKSLSFTQILDCSVHLQDSETRRRQKWKEMKHFYDFTKNPKYRHCSLENALWSNSDGPMTSEYFIVKVTGEYDFDSSTKFYNHLRWMYWSFDGGTENEADWRDILATYTILQYFRLIKDSPVELLVKLFEIYTIGDRLGRNIKNPNYVMVDPVKYIPRILTMTCLLDKDVSALNTLMSELDLLKHIDLQFPRNQMKQREFQHVMNEEKYAPVVKLWSKMGWERLSTEQRLTVVDEAQMFHKRNADHLLMRYKLQQALMIFAKNLSKVIVREWRLVTLRESGVRNFIVKKMYRKRKRLFLWLYSYTKHKWQKRRKRMLADVMGMYAMKARCFARIKLFNYNTARLRVLVGSMDKNGKKHLLAGTHLREFRRLSTQKVAFHRWWYKIKDMINYELAVRHDFERLTKWVIDPWREHAHEVALRQREENMVLANKQRFDAMMEEAEQTAQLLHKLEMEKQAKEKAEREAQEKLEAEERKAEAKRRAQMEKMAERAMLLDIQRDERRRQIGKTLQRMKDDFKEEWDLKAIDMKIKAKNRMTTYIENPHNRLTIQLRFEKLKKEFYQPPTPENQARERMLTDPKNIAFLYVMAKLQQTNSLITDLIPVFDKKKKGYLSYDEFHLMLLSTGAKLSKVQLGQICRGVDKTKSNFIDSTSLLRALEELDVMGVSGSPWKMYVDPADDVMCYHNFETGQKVFEYRMTDELLREINISNMYGEEEEKTVVDIRELKREDWDLRMKNYMARRIQFMYRQRKARKWRGKRVWKALNKQRQIENERQKRFARKVESLYMGFRARQEFKKHLIYIYEKVWDVSSGVLFWHNHKTGESSWTMPYMLQRYGDVSKPSPWLPNEVAIQEGTAEFGGRPTTVSSASSESSYRTQSRPGSAVLPGGSSGPTTTSNVGDGGSLLALENGDGSNEGYSYNVDGSYTNEDDEVGVGVAYQGGGGKKREGGGAITGKNVRWGLEFNTEESAADITGMSSDAGGGDDFQVAIRPDTADTTVTSNTGAGETMYQIHYWHATAMRSLPRKPDGYPLCGVCTRNIAIRNCVDCQLQYCWTCHEETHSCPLGVAQNLKATRQQLSNPIFLQKMNYFQNHTFEPSKPVKCKMCTNGRALAGIHCNTCNTDMCRSCARRLHDHNSKIRHEFFEV